MTRRSLLTLTLAALAAACGDTPLVQAPTMALSATAATFSAATGGAAPAAQEIAITNGGAGVLTAPAAQVTYADGAGWLTEATVTGAAAPFTLRLRATPGTLASGTYRATVRLTSLSAVNSGLTVAVTFNVTAGMVVRRTITSWGQDGAGATAAAADVSSVTLLVDAAAGGATRTPLTAGGTAGTWVGDPPAAAWWAEVAWADGHTSWIRGSGNLLDLGEDEGGRAGRTAPAQATPVTPVLDGLDPWGGDAGILFDTLAVYAWGPQALTWVDQNSTSGFPLFGGETQLDGDLSSFSFDWRTSGGGLLAAADTVYVTQLRQVQKLVGGAALLEYLRPVATTSATDLAMADGQPFGLAPPLMTSKVDVNDGTFTLSWRRSAFEEALPPYTSLGRNGHLVGVYATPAPLTATAPLGAVAMPLLLCQDPFGVTTDFNGGPVAWARVQPAAWREYLLARHARGVVRKAPGATTGLPGAEDLVYRYDAIAAAPAQIAPLVSAPTAPTVDGQPALGTTILTGVALTPVVAWEAPATGAPTSYRVEVHKLTRNGTATEGTRLAEFVVDGATTSVTLPAGLLQAATTYAATVAARSSPTDAGGTTPYRAGVPFGEGRLWTAPFTTAP